MKLYKSPENEVYAFSPDGSQDEFIPSDLVPITQEEADAIIAARLAAAQPIVPVVVSRFQAKAALLAAGLLDDVEALMAAPTTPEIAKLAWAEALEFRRDSPTIAAMAVSLRLTDQQIDDLFIAASRITA